MCRFFSFCSDGKGKLFYFNAEQREAFKQSNPHNYEPDSHTSIADFHGYRGAKEDTLNKWEYNPLLKTLVADYINATNDEAQVSAAMASLDFKTIVPRLRIKPIIHPFKVLRRGAVVTKQEEELLKTWGSVRASVRDSVGGSVGASVWAYIGSFYDIKDYKFQSAVDLWEAGLVPSLVGKAWRLHSRDGIIYEKKLAGGAE